MSDEPTAALIVFPNGLAVRAVGHQPDPAHLDYITHCVREALADGKPLVLGGDWRVEAEAPGFVQRTEWNGCAVEYRAPTLEGLRETVAAFTKDSPKTADPHAYARTLLDATAPTAVVEGSP